MILGQAYATGIGTLPQDFDKAYKYFSSCEDHDPWCLAGIAHLYINVPPGKSLYVPWNENKGYDLLKKAINMKVDGDDTLD